MSGSYVYTGTGREIDEEAAWDYIHDGYLLSPRTVLKGRIKLPPPELTHLPVDVKKLNVVLQDTLETSLGNISGTRRAVMFSGGFDSMLIACLAERHGAQVTAVTVEFDEFNPLTVAGSVELAHKAGIAHHVLHVKAVEFLSSFEELTGITDEPILDLDLAIVYAALKKYDPKIGGHEFISGMGSDQWFGNMALEAWPGGFASRLDWAFVDTQAHRRVAEAHGCKIVFPFLSRPMLALSQSVPDELKVDKKLLRALAIANTIPHRGMRTEIQVPSFLRQLLIKTYGHRAWPSPVSLESRGTNGSDEILRQIILGLWLEKVKEEHG